MFVPYNYKPHWVRIGRTMAPMGQLTATTQHLCKASVGSPIGRLTVVVSAVGLCKIYFPALTDAESAELNKIETDPGDELMSRVISQLEEYFAGDRRGFDVPLDVVGTPFQVEAWHALADIPFGTTATYAQQAANIGRPKAIRAVGGANRVNPVPVVLPCHRIIGANGALTGFAGGLEMKKWLLQHELDVVARKK